MLVLLLCLPLLTSALFDFDTDNDSVPEVQDSNDGDGDTNSTETKNWYCPKDWIPYSDKLEKTCLLEVKEKKTFDEAREHCQSLDGYLVIFTGEKKKKFVTDIPKEGRYWIGLYKANGYGAPLRWLAPNDRIRLRADTSAYRTLDETDYVWPRCGIISSYSSLDSSNCEGPYASVCEREMSCTPGTFGDDCAKTCHCQGEPCRVTAGQVDVTCKDGCQRHWTGRACDIEKQNPEVRYFCINSSGDEGKSVFIRIYTKGIQYRAIYGLTTDKVKGDWCPSTYVEVLNLELTTIRIQMDEDTVSQMSSGGCAGQKLDEDKFTWNIEVREYDGISQENDLKVTITCDFHDADSLVRSNQYSPHREAINYQSVQPEPLQDDVHLQVCDMTTGQAVNESTIGSTVYLEIKYALRPGSLVTGVTPFNCEATSPDGKHTKKLLDQLGCQVRNAPIQAFRLADDKRVITPWFHLFAFEDESPVIFRCSFHLCFTSECPVGCRSGPRWRRDTAVERADTSITATRSIRVLPSIAATGDNEATRYQPAPPAPPAAAAAVQAGYEMGHMVYYLNPVTCTFFLLILLVFLCMYIAFVRTLRKSVYDIRKEIEVKRSRDKFLHCGCVQQKDRDYVSP